MRDGVDLSGACVGEMLDLPPREAYLLLAEERAEPAQYVHRRT